jgi:hypothetical protein
MVEPVVTESIAAEQDFEAEFVSVLEELDNTYLIDWKYRGMGPVQCEFRTFDDAGHEYGFECEIGYNPDDEEIEQFFESMRHKDDAVSSSM